LSWHCASENGFISPPLHLVMQILRLREQVPITELAIVSNFRGLEHQNASETHELFALEVMPVFR
jgi:hypothetical protein